MNTTIETIINKIAKQSPKVTHPWIRRIMTVVATFFSGLMFLILLGVMIPSIPYLGEGGTILESFLSLHLVIASFILGLLSYGALRLGGKRAVIIALTMSIVNVIGFSVPVVVLINTAREHQVDISWSKYLSGKLESGTANLSKSIKYASIDGKDLYMDISKPENVEGSVALTPIVLIHGGGFVSGERNQEPAWTKFYNDRGYVVFDVDYRLATESYHTWDKAAPDIATAIVWIGKYAKKYNVVMNKLLIAGSSAGGGLAIQVAYSIQDGTLKAYSQGYLAHPKAVVAICPAQDETAVWEDDTRFFGMKVSALNNQYLGGSPKDYPEAYAATTASNHITKQAPPTLVIVGKNDHLLPYKNQAKFADNLTKMGVPNEFVAIPFNDHFYTIATGSIGSQISFKVASEFLDKYGK